MTTNTLPAPTRFDNFFCGRLAKLLCVFVGNTSGLGVFANKRLRSAKRILHRPWSRRRSILICLFLNCNLARCVKRDTRGPEPPLTFRCEGQWSSGSSEHRANAEAARRAAVVRPGRRSGCSRWGHPWSRRTRCSVSIGRTFYQKIRGCRPKQWMTWNDSKERVHIRIGISEKGSATVKLSVSTAPGHSSMPPRETSIGILAAAIKR